MGRQKDILDITQQLSNLSSPVLETMIGQLNIYCVQIMSFTKRHIRLIMLSDQK